MVSESGHVKVLDFGIAQPVAPDAAAPHRVADGVQFR